MDGRVVARHKPLPGQKTYSQRSLLKKRWAWSWLTVFLFFVAVSLALASPMAQIYNANKLAQQSATAALATDDEKEEMKKAHAYNRKLVEDGQRVLGDAVDPFTQDKDQIPISQKDKTYNSILDTDGNGVMGSISIPSISVKLPIYHGTSLATLDKGAGHMYGTSLPVGGKDALSVISAHTGSPKALFFTHLDEMRKGDTFYIHVAGQTLAYKVDQIDVILPDDFSKLTIRKGEDRVTLMTCTPYGRNTHRLLVSGIRAQMPEVAPYEKDVQARSTFDWEKDWSIAAAAAGTPVFLDYFAWMTHQCRREFRLLPSRRQHKRAAK